MRILARRSIVAAVNLSPGDVLTKAHLEILRPATGIAPKEFNNLIGQLVIKAVKAGSSLQWTDLANS